jgi:hypothetical protein
MMSSRRYLLAAIVVASLATRSTATAELNAETTPAKQAMPLSRTEGDPHAAQNVAAMRKVARDPALIAAYKKGDAKTVQSIVVRAGGSPDIVIAIPSRGSAVLSSGGAVDFIDNPGTCVAWQWFQWWTDIPYGHWYWIRECIRIINAKGEITYSG